MYQIGRNSALFRFSGGDVEGYFAVFAAPPMPFRRFSKRAMLSPASTNAIESLNARYRRAIKARGHFPNELAALKCRYLVTQSLDPTGQGRPRWMMR